ncbi:MAG: bifunctional riboflavin kinase/FAD synthetase [Lentimicrobium sp.]|nr:bifunctional riboflavin kinase/FAD synthetase [Lentimicrobium sp.]
MEIINDLLVPLTFNRPVITVGTFDGVHIGHQSILEKMKKIASETGGETVVITFHPHPRLVLGNHVYLLSTRDEKRKILQSSGISHLVEIPFTKEFAAQSAPDFIRWIAARFIPSVIVIGYDHGFGQNRSGSIEHLYRFGKELGFRVIEVPELELGNHHVSSSVVRWLLQEGDAVMASALLGRPYSVTGKVVRGNQIGKLIGYPTANLFIEEPNKLIPAMGVYASKVTYKGDIFNGMTNIGLRPTINAHKLTIETNIFDFDSDIYYESITVELIRRIRNEKKFGNLEILKNQLAIDKGKALNLLTELPQE